VAPATGTGFFHVSLICVGSGARRALRSVGAEVTEVLVVVEKGDRGGSLAQELGVTIRSLVKVEIREGRVAVVGGVT
jgi:hypothetical protein